MNACSTMSFLVYSRSLNTGTLRKQIKLKRYMYRKRMCLNRNHIAQAT